MRDGRPGKPRVPPKKGERVERAECRASGADGEPARAAGAGRAVVFVDVDGVLNGNGQPDDRDCFWPDGHEAAMREGYLVLSRDRLERFAQLVLAQDLDIVLSTSWRLVEPARAALLAAFAEAGIDCASRVLGDTPDLSQTSEGLYPAGVRGDELAAWLECHGWPPWIAIDDGPMATDEAESHRPAPLMPGHFVMTDGSEGLDEEAAQMAAALLRERRRSWQGGSAAQ